MSRTGLLAKFFGDRRGTAALEVALTLPIFLGVCLGIAELGLYVAQQQALTEAVFAGERYAIVHGSQSSSPASASTILTQVQNNCGMLAPGNISVSVTFSPNNSPGSTVAIVATYPWTPLFTLFYLPSVTITARSDATILH